ncbi:MAG TPA: nitroreductase [Candidatus Aenigmarchaeota archaeon]|nr:MAG: nitroreductase [Candidatus Aenigmarchaeota archaeon]HDD46473.1 nitroreductase [Candidatus Aenigmarchaeota archaeon]
MGVYDLIIKRRTIRKFKQEKIKKDILIDCLNAARLAPSAANLQPLEYILVTRALDKVFECTRWAGYLKNGKPKQHERPVAYIVIISNKEVSKDAKYDAGFAASNIILTALERGVASCVIGSIDRERLAKNLSIPKNYNIELVIALGYGKQKSVEEEFKGDVRYWLDEKGILHVPKKRLGDIVHEERFFR